VPKGLTGTMFPFRYNDIGELRSIEANHGSELAAIVMEPARDEGPAAGFLEEVRAIAARTGAVLVFDEVTSGFRLTTGGIHLVYGVRPDVAVFAKAMGNGYPIAAIVGTRAVMEAAEGTFISSTSWTERIGPSAALATIRKHRRLDVPAHLVRVGSAIQRAWRESADSAGLKVHVSGIAPLGHLAFEDPQHLALTTLFTQEMLDRGILASGSFYATYAHKEEHIDLYASALEQVFPRLSDALAGGDVTKRLRGPQKHAGFQRLA
jgi:glutamate-1-semialdehyde 2,1-aminomutase